MTTHVRHPRLPLSVRLRAARKLVSNDQPYLLIPIKPAAMVQPRLEGHVYGPAAKLLDDHVAEIVALAADMSDRGTAIRNDLGSLLDNSFFSEGDALAAYGLVQRFKPRRIIEVGSGSSTHIMRRAAQMAGLSLSITCIDPQPRRDIDSVADHIVRRSVLECPADLADDLEAGDVLFIDGSHYAFNGTDVPFLMLEVMPRLKQGVLVHVHDIALPYEYPITFVQRNYNEQYVLAGLLLGGGTWKPLFPVHWLNRQNQWPVGMSFWLQKA